MRFRLLPTCLAVAALAVAASATFSVPLQFDIPPTPANGTTFLVTVGNTLTFPVQVSDADPTEVVQLRGSATFPPGATATPPLPALGNPVATVFNWTPTAAQVGNYTVTFSALNSFGVRAALSINITVMNPPTGLVTVTQGGWGSKPAGHNPGKLLADNFASVYPSGVEIGIAGAGGFSLKFTSAKAIENFLPAGSTPGALDADATNPLSSAAGVFAGQVLALQLSVDFSAAGKTPTGLGGLKLQNTGNASLDGKTISEVLAGANQALGGGPLPFGIASYSDLNDLITNLNEGFDNGHVTGWATVHLTP